jgi:hypothetical protein
VHGRVEHDGPLVNVIGAKFRALDDLEGARELAHRSHDFR